jgi:hypothetical protein
MVRRWFPLRLPTTRHDKDRRSTRLAPGTTRDVTPKHPLDERARDHRPLDMPWGATTTDVRSTTTIVFVSLDATRAALRRAAHIVPARHRCVGL